MGAVAAAGGSRRTRLRYVTERRGFLATLLISPAVIVIAALVGAPLVLAAYLSFTDAQAGSLTGKWVGLANFRNALHDPIFRGALWHTLTFTVISQAIVVVCAGLLAHALIRNFRGRWFLRFLVLLPWAAPIALTAIGFLWFYDPQASIFNWFLIKLHLVNAHSTPNWLGTPKAAMSSIITVQSLANDSVRDRDLPRRNRDDSAGGRRCGGDRRRDRTEEVLVRLAAATASNRHRRGVVRDHLHGDRHGGAVHPHERRAPSTRRRG